MTVGFVVGGAGVGCVVGPAGSRLQSAVPIQGMQTSFLFRRSLPPRLFEDFLPSPHSHLGSKLFPLSLNGIAY